MNQSAPATDPVTSNRSQLVSNVYALLLGLGIAGAVFVVLETISRLVPQTSYLVYDDSIYRMGYGEINPLLRIWHPKPNMTMRTFHPKARKYFTQSTDSEGFRIIPGLDTKTVNPSKKRLSVLTLGDSFTWGHAVDDDQTYPYYMYQSLCDKLSDRQIDVHNGANIWMTINEQLAVYQYLNQRERFDIVTLCFCPINDLAELSVIQRRLKRLDESGKHPFVSSTTSALMRKSALVRLLFWLVKSNASYKSYQAEGERDFALHQDKYFAEYESLFKQLAEQTKRRNQKLICFSTNTGKVRPKNIEHVSFFVGLVEKYGACYLPIKYRRSDYLRYDAHFSPSGNRHVADEIVKFITQDQP